jgi:hypothetical protein
MSNLSTLPSTLDQVLVTSLADIGKSVTDNAYSSNTLLGLLGREAKKLINGGAQIVRPLADEIQDDGGFYLGADTLNTTQSDTLTSVEIKWQNIYEPIEITRDEERQNSGDEHKIIDLLGTKINLSTLAIRRRAERAMSTPTAGAGNLNDLETIVNTGVLGSINGATNTAWQASVTASGPFATQGLTDMTTNYYMVSGGEQEDNPTHFFTNKTVFQKFEQTRLPLERLSPGGTANAGFEALTFKGKPLTYGNHIGSGLMFGLNINYLELVVDSETDFAVTPFVFPSNQTAKIAFILWRGNFLTTNRRRHFKLTSIS